MFNRDPQTEVSNEHDDRDIKRVRGKEQTLLIGVFSLDPSNSRLDARKPLRRECYLIEFIYDRVPTKLYVIRVPKMAKCCIEPLPRPSESCCAIVLSLFLYRIYCIVRSIYPPNFHRSRGTSRIGDDRSDM